MSLSAFSRQSCLLIIQEEIPATPSRVMQTTITVATDAPGVERHKSRLRGLREEPHSSRLSVETRFQEIPPRKRQDAISAIKNTRLPETRLRRSVDAARSSSLPPSTGMESGLTGNYTVSCKIGFTTVFQETTFKS